MAHGRGSRRARAVLTALGALFAAAISLAVISATSAGAATTTATLNPGQTGTVGTGFNQSCDQGPGWIFVLPAADGDAFVSLSATFLGAGTVQGTVLANTKFASVQVPLTDTLLSATAQVTNGSVGSHFNLTHVCSGSGSTTTTTTTQPTTTTTAGATTTTTTVETTTTVGQDTTTTTVGDTTTTTIGEQGSTTTSTVPGDTTTSTSVSPTSVVGDTTTSTVVSAGSTDTTSTTGGAAVTTAASGTGGSNLPFTGAVEWPALLGLGAFGVGGALRLVARRRAAAR